MRTGTDKGAENRQQRAARAKSSTLARGFWLLALGLVGFASASVWTTDGTDSLIAAVEKLDFSSVSINAEGTVTLAPSLVEKAAPGDNSVWCACRDKAGNIYFGTGSAARLYRLNRGSGKPELVHDGGTGEVLALAADAQGNVFFAATPEAKVYRIKPGQKPEIFFETFEKYVFSLLTAADGSVYCATGEHGKLYRISPAGKGVEIFAAPQAHLSALAWLVPNKELLVGTSPDGIVYRLDLTTGQTRPKVSVLYDTPDNEVRSIVAATGICVGTNPSPDSTSNSARPHVYSVRTDGTLRWSWTSPDSTLFALSAVPPSSFRPSPSLLVATGNRGLIYQLDTLGRPSVIHKTADKQVLCLVPTAEGTWLGTGSTARLGFAGSGFAREGRLESRPFDCQNPARFGRLDFRASVPMGTALAFDTRSGNSTNPDSTWNDWREATGSVASEPARFIQWRARFSSEFPNRTPSLQRTELYYGIANRAPLVRRLDVAAVSLDDARKGAAKPTRTITWEAVDPDSDSLRYELYFRREGESGWQRVAKDITDSKFDLDTRALADGWHELKLAASDRVDQVEQSALTTEFTSRPFLVDNTTPAISDIRVSARKSGSSSPSTPGLLESSNPVVIVSFTATDALSPIAASRVTTNAGEWQPAEPVDGIFDSMTERLSVQVRIAPGDNTIAVWAADAQGNIGTARAQMR
jgi:outer membrane protein assembly factor BamB